MNDTMGTASMLDELERLEDRVRRDRRPGSIPLTVLAATTMLYSLLQWRGLSTESPGFTDPWWFWVIAAPTALILTARWYRKVEHDVGVSTRRIVNALVVASVVSLLLFPFLGLPLGTPFVLLGAALATVGASRRSVHLIVGAVVFGVGGVLESLSVLSNRVHELAGTYVAWAGPAAWTAISALLLASAVSAWRHEINP